MLNKILLKVLGRLEKTPASRFIEFKTWTTERSVLKLLSEARRYKAAAKGSPISANEERLLSFKDKHKGERVFIIGNGPSLNQLDLTKLKGELTFGVNGIFLNYDKMGFAPTYYVVEDTFVAEDRADEINTYKGPMVQFFGNYLDYCIKDKPDNVWLNVKLDYRDYEGFPHFSENAIRQIWVGGSVTYICLQLAFYMGFSEVYMIGFDHNYVIPDDAVISNKRETGFDIMSNSDDVNHFHPDYFGKGYRWHEPRVERMEKGFMRAREHFEKDGRKIYNATPGGHLHVYPRVEYKSLFK